MTENMPSPTHGPNASPGSRPGARSAVRAIVTVGPTHEPIDAVRYIGNRSSGRMGLAIAEALRRAGCEVTVLAGPGVTIVTREGHLFTRHSVSFHAPDSELHGVLSRQRELRYSALTHVVSLSSTFQSSLALSMCRGVL